MHIYSSLDYYVQGGNFSRRPSHKNNKIMGDIKPFSGSWFGGLAGNLIGSGLGQLMQGGISSLFSSGYWTAQRQLRNNLQLMDRQAELQREQYDYEMQQESPAMQRKRLEAAGLNPSLMYGSGAGAGVSASMGSPSLPTSSAPYAPIITNPMQIQDLSLKASQTKKNEADARLVNAEAEEKERTNKGGLPDALVDKAFQEVAGIRVVNRLKELEADFAESSFNERFNAIKLGNQLMVDEHEQNKVSIGLLIQQYLHNKEMMPLQREELLKKIATYAFQWSLLEAETYKAVQQGRIADSEIAKNYSQSALFRAEKERIDKLDDAELELLEQQVREIRQRIYESLNRIEVADSRLSFDKAIGIVGSILDSFGVVGQFVKNILLGKFYKKKSDAVG